MLSYFYKLGNSLGIFICDILELRSTYEKLLIILNNYVCEYVTKQIGMMLFDNILVLLKALDLRH